MLSRPQHNNGSHPATDNEEQDEVQQQQITSHPCRNGLVRQTQGIQAAPLACPGVWLEHTCATHAYSVGASQPGGRGGTWRKRAPHACPTVHPAHGIAAMADTMASKCVSTRQPTR